MSLVGRWVDESEFHTPPESLLTDEELVNKEPDATPGQLKFIYQLMIQLKMREFPTQFTIKDNGKPSIGTAKELIEYLLNKCGYTTINEKY